MPWQVEHLGGKALEAEDRAGGTRFDLLEGPRHAERVLPVDPDVIEQAGRRAQPGQVRRIQLDALLSAVPAGELVMVANVRMDRSAGGLLSGAGVAIVIDVPVADEDAPHVPQRDRQLVEAGVQRGAAVLRSDAGVEQGDSAALLL